MYVTILNEENKCIEIVSLSELISIAKKVPSGTIIKYAERIVSDDSYFFNIEDDVVEDLSTAMIFGTPLVYFNGNIIDTRENKTHGEFRSYHYELLQDYLRDMKLHKTDIIELSPEQWNNMYLKGNTAVDELFYNSKYLSCKAVKLNSPYNMIMIIESIANDSNVKKMTNAFKTKYKLPVFLILDDGTGLIKESSSMYDVVYLKKQ